MTEVVALHAPSAAWLGDTTTTTWTCTQAIIDEGVQCDLNAVVSTTRANEFPTPSGCVVIVTVAKNGRGHGSYGVSPSGTSAVPRNHDRVEHQRSPNLPQEHQYRSDERYRSHALNGGWRGRTTEEVCGPQLSHDGRDTSEAYNRTIGRGSATEC